MIEWLLRACHQQTTPVSHEKVAVEYSTDETDEDKIPKMGEGMAFPRKTKTVKLTLPATPSQVHLAMKGLLNANVQKVLEVRV